MGENATPKNEGTALSAGDERTLTRSFDDDPDASPEAAVHTASPAGGGVPNAAEGAPPQEDAGPPARANPHPAGAAKPGEEPRQAGDRSGARLGAFRVLHKLGEGGMGVVYAAEDTRLGRVVALKILPPAAVANPDKRRRFLREARAASAVLHPGIAAVFEVGEHQGEVYVAMERVAGRTLRAVLREHSAPLSVARALTVTRDLARALACAHQAGVAHRDLKPENVMETPELSVKILDFGLAKRFGEAADAEADRGDVATAEGKILGTPGYMAPEQTRGGAVDGRTDIFSLGVILFELLADVRPFRGPSAMAVLIATDRDPAPAPSSLRAEVPASVDAIVARCLAKRPSDRFATCNELADALDAALADLAKPSAGLASRGSQTSALDPGVAPGPAISRGGRGGWVALGLVAVAALLAAIRWLGPAAPPSGVSPASSTAGPESPSRSSGAFAGASARGAGTAGPASTSSAAPNAATNAAPNAALSVGPGERPSSPRRPCIKGDAGLTLCSGPTKLLAWCDPAGQKLACCGPGLVPKGPDGMCVCAPGGTRAAEARARGCADVAADATERFREAKMRAVTAAIACFEAIAQEKRAGGEFAAAFHLTPEGDVFGARVEQCSLPDEKAQACALDALRKTRFPPPAAEDAGRKEGFGFLF